MTDREAIIHLIGGAAGGTAATAITCPLEVIKTRMQSSRGIDNTFQTPSSSGGGGGGGGETSVSSRESAIQRGPSARNFSKTGTSTTLSRWRLAPALTPYHSIIREQRMYLHTSSLLRRPAATTADSASRVNIVRHAVNIVRNEGMGALYKGLGPNLIGVAPSKAVYFYTYSLSKRYWNESEWLVTNSAIVHMISAGTAGFMAATAVNPIWLVKTRLQLNRSKIGVFECAKRVFQRDGIRGFYRGVTASYVGVSETMIQFVLYEHLRAYFVTAAQERLEGASEQEKQRTVNFANFMLAGGTAKFIACVVAYPHEVVRTRLREEPPDSWRGRRNFFTVLAQLYREGYRSMYRGLSVQLLRTVPNTAITMGVYELVVNVLRQL